MTGQPGAEHPIPFRVDFGQPSSWTRRSTIDPARGTITSIEFGDNRLEFTGEWSSFCCPSGTLLLAPVAGRVAIVNGTSYRLDVPGTASGALTIRTEELLVTMPRAELRVLPDSVIIRALPPR